MPWEIEYLSLISTVVGEWDGYLKKDITRNDFKKIVNNFRNYNPPALHDEDIDLEEELLPNELLEYYFLRVAKTQLSHQNIIFNKFFRYNYFFTKDHNSNINENFKEVFDLNYTKYVKFSVLLFLSICKLNNYSIDNVIKKVKGLDLFTNNEVEKMVEHLTDTRSNIVTVYNKFKGTDEKLKPYFYNPLKMKPIIKYNNELYCPMPTLIFNAVTYGFYHWLCSEKDSFSQKFGENVFEDYINYILKNWGDSSYKIIPEFKYYINKEEFKSPDFILVSKDKDLIFIEAKATTPSIKLISSNRSEYMKQLEKAYGVALEQCIKKNNHIKKGYLIHNDLPDYKNIDNIYYLIVTLERFHFPPSKHMLKNIIDIYKKKEKELIIDINEEFHVVGVEGLENIIEFDNRNLFEYIEYRQNNDLTYREFFEVNINNDIKFQDTNRYMFSKGLFEEMNK